MDNTIVATHPHTHETAVAQEHTHVALPQHRHHFETEQQQREAGTFGMWLFLLTEIMFFGGLFFAYLLYRNWYPRLLSSAASNQLSIPLGAFEYGGADQLGLLHGAGCLGGRGEEEGAACSVPCPHDAAWDRLPWREVCGVPREVGEASHSRASTSMSRSLLTRTRMDLKEKADVS